VLLRKQFIEREKIVCRPYDPFFLKVGGGVFATTHNQHNNPKKGKKDTE